MCENPTRALPDLGKPGDWVKASDYDGIRRALEFRRVLVVEDDQAIRDLNRRVLERSGFRVSVAGDGLSGWNALREQNFDLLITDNEMPRMTGAQLVRRLRSARMDLPVILASGTPGLKESQPHSFARVAAVLLKPFSPRRLIETVRHVLRAETAQTAQAPGRRASGVFRAGPAFGLDPLSAGRGMMDEDWLYGGQTGVEGSLSER